jgi:mRNA-degrading endonuclease toxin of MazEF toxin-antitoxin module
MRLDKPRPAVVLSVDQLNRHALDVCVVGITTKQHRQFSMRIPIKAGEAGLDFDCWVKCDQVTTLEKTFLTYPPTGILSEETLGRIQEQVKICLGLT